MLEQVAASFDAPATASVRQMYLSLSERDVEQAAMLQAADWLRATLDATPYGLPQLPQGAEQFAAWAAAHTEAVGEQYKQYLAERKGGAPRRYFTNKAHALYFLKGVAPTKLVDGAWLFGLLQYWEQGAKRPLITTYLEELGNGVPGKNHVVIFQQLIDAHGCAQWQGLPEEHFLQGLIQLALAYNPQQFLPELIGYNLGYEQLPLHLLITSYELNELGIDPYYFTLHVTVDNADSGHARKAWEALTKLTPQVGDADAFMRRVEAGYRLNDLGASTQTVIDSFDLHAELVGILRSKSAVGKNMHSDYCKVGGRMINDWLSDPDQVPAFLVALEKQGWFTRGETPEQSRFWGLLHGDHAQMFGVFSAYEEQVLHDWMATPSQPLATAPVARVATHRALQRAAGGVVDGRPRRIRESAERGLIRHRFPDDEHAWGAIACDLRLLEAKLAASDSKEEAIAMLIALMSPATHHTSAGLMATRIFSKLFA
ncbi:iron-containing redox enzyme family protein [Massilia sp. TWR1-2-2]|uniref:iron-containing redox enzyme family protein n=1 Tax=Massilia sp. TWR1-2-2 TaxID=2804584 RepID=UPI003CF4C3DD